MAETKSAPKAEKEVAPQGEVELKGADKAAEDAGRAAVEEYVAGVEKLGEVIRTANETLLVGQPTAGAEAYVAHAQKLAEGEAKFTKDGLRIGVDGVNPVSNENPDPRVIDGVTRH